jgi:hypothetical protein
MSNNRYWDSELAEWVYESDVDAARDATTLAIDEFYNGDKEWATRWMLRALAANKPIPMDAVLDDALEPSKFLLTLGKRG